MAFAWHGMAWHGIALVHGIDGSQVGCCKCKPCCTHRNDLRRPHRELVGVKHEGWHPATAATNTKVLRVAVAVVADAIVVISTAIITVVGTAATAVAAAVSKA